MYDGKFLICFLEDAKCICTQFHGNEIGKHRVPKSRLIRCKEKIERLHWWIQRPNFRGNTSGPEGTSGGGYGKYCSKIISSKCISNNFFGQNLIKILTKNYLFT
jgi:hypothetical protein